MKKIIIGVSGIMMVGLIISIIIYQKPNQISPPQLDQTIQGQDTNQSQNQEPEQPQSETLQPIYADNTIAYALQNNELNITFDKGSHWIKVPVQKDLLFEGEYNGNKQELIENSYILTENRAAFLYTDEISGGEQRILLTYSFDQGKTWQNSVVSEHLSALRFRKVDFLNDSFGYVIVSGDRTMSQEISSVFLTHDGGESWTETNQSGVTRLIYDGGFIDELTGFLSYGTINPEEPDLYVTQDGGKTWNKAIMHIPSQYHKIFVTSEIPVEEGDHLAVLVNQGPNGDYEGGKVKGKFISKDNGKTWEFSMEVKPNEEGKTY